MYPVIDHAFKIIIPIPLSVSSIIRFFKSCLISQIKIFWPIITKAPTEIPNAMPEYIS
jgi:hypothetical protein